MPPLDQDYLPDPTEDTPDGPDDVQADPHDDPAVLYGATLDGHPGLPLVGAPAEFANAQPGEAREDEL